MYDWKNSFKRDSFQKSTKNFREKLSSLSTPTRKANNVYHEKEGSEKNPFMTDKSRLSLNRDLLTLKIIFVDILLIFCNLGSDISQGVAIWLKDTTNEEGESKNDRLKYAITSFAIIWAPGIPAAIHFLSVRRLKLVWYRGVMFGFLIILFYRSV